MISPDETAQIKALNQRLQKPITLGLELAADAAGRGLQAFGQLLVQLAPQVTIRNEDPSDIASRLNISDAIHYRAVPTGTELPPFLEMLAMLSGDTQSTGYRHAHVIEAIDRPVRMKLYVSAMCPHCQLMTRQLFPMALMNPIVDLTIIDAAQFYAEAENDRVQAVPTLIMDDELRWTGRIDQRSLIDIIKKRDPAEMGADLLSIMIQNGAAYRLAGWMLERDTLFPAFIDLLCHDAFSIRLGAMAAFEEIAEKRRSLAAKVVAPLMEHFAAAPDTIRGDLIYVMGESGDPSIIAFLEKTAAETNNPEIKEATTDAIARINIINHPP